MSISKECIEAAQRAYHELDEGGESIEKCWEAALQAAFDVKAKEQPERCKHGVWAADRCEDCCKEQPVDMSAMAKLIHTAIGFDEPWDNLGDTMGINRSREAAKAILRANKRESGSHQGKES